MLSSDPNAMMIMENPDSVQWLIKSFEGFVKTHPDTLSIYFGTIDKKMHIAPAQEMDASYDPTSRGWYKDAITKKYVMTFAKAVKDNKGKTVGVIGLDIDLELISNMVANIKLGKDGFSAILDATGTIIAHKNKAY